MEARVFIIFWNFYLRDRNYILFIARRHSSLCQVFSCFGGNQTLINFSFPSSLQSTELNLLHGNIQSTETLIKLLQRLLIQLPIQWYHLLLPCNILNKINIYSIYSLRQKDFLCRPIDMSNQLYLCKDATSFPPPTHSPPINTRGTYNK